ncbi:PAS domain S-box-containing protein [Halarchaeum rubridurum]|uniref:Bacterio-opsin activator n=1 Tax=Halarchaeum rubridurum TaxID=489911 RepID=A0A830FXK5_9EURY|nr:bacterio-opsin activator domain-containing protein [Halarchaeum rubridurum]MBP1954394.1 PAS domain S-box-containing protein [Halarchaeum rubridurum]GGM60633.1 bacterio-opsin activator [Halarchaeum rubridurum]
MAPRHGMDDDPPLPDAVKERAMDEAPVGITMTDPTRPDNPLVYVNDAFERITGYAREDVLGRNCRFLQGPETDAARVDEMRRAVAAGEPTVVELRNYRADGEPFWNEVKIAPIRDDDGDVRYFVGFQRDVTERTRSERAVRRERANLEHVLDRVDGLLGDVTEAVVNAESREAIERQVCERLAAVETYALAWLGDVDLAEGVVRPRAWAGDADGVRAADLAVARDDTAHPVVRALDEGRVALGDGETAVPTGIDAVDGVAAVPLRYRGTTYGVLAVYATDADALNERETAVLESLGRTVATALNAHESRRLAATDQVVSVAFDVRDRELFFVDLAARLPGSLTYRGEVYRGETPVLFFTADADAERVLAAAAESPGIEDATVVGGADEAPLFEFRLPASSFPDDLAARGVRIEGVSAADGGARVELELPMSVDTRSVVERVRERYDDVELVRYRETERPPTTERDFVAAVEERLTDRQHAALKRAYLSGYYDATRTATGDELAAAMGVSRATFHQHLRAAERKVFAAIFDRDT